MHLLRRRRSIVTFIFLCYVILVDRGGTNSYKFKISCKFMLISMTSLRSFDLSVDDTLLNLESKENCFCLQSLVSNDTHGFLSFVTHFKIYFHIINLLLSCQFRLIFCISGHSIYLGLFKNYFNFTFYLFLVKAIFIYLLVI